MIKKHKPQDIREPGFLLWLGKFVGEWKLEVEVEVRRRDDGFLEAHSIPDYNISPIGILMEKGKFVKPAESPLGPYPIALSTPLMHHWLTDKEAERFREAWHVARGRQLMLETVERRIAEIPESERNSRWLEWWAKGTISSPALSDKEMEAHRMLHKQYLKEFKITEINYQQDTPRYFERDEEFLAQQQKVISKARKSLPIAKNKYLNGLPTGSTFFVTMDIYIENKYSENAYVKVIQWDRDEITGLISTQLIYTSKYQYGQKVNILEKDVIDWTIVEPDGNEEGNYLGKFYDLYSVSKQKNK